MQHSLLTRLNSHLQVTMLMCRADPSGSLIFQSGEGCQDLEPHVLGAHDRLCMPWFEIFCAGSWCWTAMRSQRALWSPCPATWCTDILTPTLSPRSSCLTAGCLTVSFASVEAPCPCCTLSAKDSQNHACLQPQDRGGCMLVWRMVCCIPGSVRLQWHLEHCTPVAASACRFPSPSCRLRGALGPNADTSISQLP